MDAVRREEAVALLNELGAGEIEHAVGLGWDLGITGLALHLATDEPVDPAEFATWTASDEGRRFITLSSERWCDADVAAGTDPDAAREAAARTATAYLGG